MLKLVIANKLYSSWSLRPWSLLKAFDIPFEEIVIPPETAGQQKPVAGVFAIRKSAGADRRRCDGLGKHGHRRNLAEAYPDRAIWPRDLKARARARWISNEMHGGFQPFVKPAPCTSAIVSRRRR